MNESFSIFPIGLVKIENDSVRIEIFDKYADGLLGLAGFSHIQVLFWFHENDNPEKRAVLQVHPRRDDHNPLTGVFGTHSPVRPNLTIVSIHLNLPPVLSLTCHLHSFLQRGLDTKQRPP